VLVGSPHATRSLAAAISGVARPGDTILLVGEMGAGKTAFAQGFAAGLGVQGPVTSPTFTLVREYECPPSATGIRLLLHADVYRLDSLDEVADLGLPELVEDEAVVLVEWGDVAAPVLSKEALIIRLEPGPEADHERFVTVAASPAWSARTEELREALVPPQTDGANSNTWVLQ
jgi:tRNA threonylcarbamoyladenosine biosynthesis protein TsaE